MNKKRVLIVFSFLTILGLFVAIYQYTKEFQAEFASATGTKPSNGHLWSEMECDGNGLCVDSTNGRVGIGVASPVEKLQVQGKIKASGDICSSSICLNQVATYYDNNALYSPSGTGHTIKNCNDVGGTVISNPDGSGAAICQFTNSSGTACPSGWTNYKNWSTLIGDESAYYYECQGSPGTAHCNHSHAWSNTAPSVSGPAYTIQLGALCQFSNYTSQAPCGAYTVTQVGCY